MAAMAMVACGEKATLPESASKQKIATNQPESSKNETKQQTPTTDIHIGPSKGPIIRRGLIEVEVPAALEPKIPTNAFINTLGMPFVKVPELDVQFCIWETHVCNVRKSGTLVIVYYGGKCSPPVKLLRICIIKLGHVPFWRQ